MHLSIRSRLDSRSRGDTIVEVMIAIAVVAMVLGGAYVTTNRSLQATRAAEERSIALKLAESQIEQLKGLMSTSPGLISGAPSSFCITADVSDPVVAASETDCGVGSNGLPSEDEPIFRLSIVKSTANDFILTVQWDDISGDGRDSLQLRYRAYE